MPLNTATFALNSPELSQTPVYVAVIVPVIATLSRIDAVGPVPLVATSRPPLLALNAWLEGGGVEGVSVYYSMRH